MDKSKKKSIKREVIEVVDITGTANSTMSWLEQYFKDVSKAPVAKQAAVGGLSGWVVGYLSMKVGKVVATVVGGSMIMLQLAAYQGYIKVDWKRVNNDLENSAKKLSKEVESRLKPGVADKKSFSRKLDKQINKTCRNLGLDDLESTADTWLQKRSRSMRKLYRRYILGDNSVLTLEELYAINAYIIAFSAGALLGRAVGRIL